MIANGEAHKLLDRITALAPIPLIREGDERRTANHATPDAIREGVQRVIPELRKTADLLEKLVK